MTTLRRCFPNSVIEKIANILGDTGKGLSGPKIHELLLDAQIEDSFQEGVNLAKRKKLYDSLVNDQNKNKCSNNILQFIGFAIRRSRDLKNEEEFERLIGEVNQPLASVGYKVEEDGKFKEINVESPISDVQIKASNLKQEIEQRNGHSEIIKYCKVELLENNYFHAVLEANKGLFQRIRDLSGVKTDGNKLIEEVFSKNPILIINNYQTNSEKNEHEGFCSLLKGLCSMFRNPTAHEPKVDWEISEQDALDILGIISYCHRRLDNYSKIR
jgi:TIGR02391 family protein